jgi:polysaccharide export outer membrane protein
MTLPNINTETSMKCLAGGLARRLLLVFCVLQIPLIGFAAEHKAGSEKNSVALYEEYTIGAGDILEIMVWKNNELTKTLPVRPDGSISLPLVGELKVAGKKVKELSEQLWDTYSQYMTDPVISVSVQQVNSMNVYIIGRVNAPGVKPITAQTNVLQGLAMASGLTPFAEGDDIQILRTQDDGTTSVLPFDYDEVSKGRNLQQNIFLKRGDVIVVP